MPAHIYSAAVIGIDAKPVEIEVDVLPGLPSFTLVGLTDKAIQESRERLTAALINLGYTPPRRKTIVSLAPASLKKEGSLYDLPIALAFLAASGQIKTKSPELEKSWFIGELGLDGTVRPVRGVLPILLSAIKHKAKSVFVPVGNKEEAAAVADKIPVYAVKSLQDVIGHINTNKTDQQLQPLTTADDIAAPVPVPEIDFADIAGQQHAKRALFICTAGGHNALMVGPPGTGKTLLAKAAAGILPPLEKDESFIVTSLYSIAGLLPESGGLIRHRPFRSPHHGASNVALIGGGTYPRPGEVSLAHQGVLFLDELPEFPRRVLEQLRQPIEDGYVSIARAAHAIRFPARSMIISAMNPCPCGFVGSTRRACTCTPSDILHYQKRISGPMLDRFDLHVLVADIPIEKLLSQTKTPPTSADFREQVKAARTRQYKRQGKTNAELNPAEINQVCVLNDISRRLLTQAQDRFRLSARGIHRLLKVAKTIADIEGKDDILPKHIAEGLQYREQLRAVLPDFA